MGDTRLIPVFIPPLVTLLARAEQLKGSPLTEPEVLAIRDKAVCMTVRAEVAREMAQNRGYDDIDPENCWAGWQDARTQMGLG